MRVRRNAIWWWVQAHGEAEAPALLPFHVAQRLTATCARGVEIP